MFHLQQMTDLVKTKCIQFGNQDSEMILIMCCEGSIKNIAIISLLKDRFNYLYYKWRIVKGLKMHIATDGQLPVCLGHVK